MDEESSGVDMECEGMDLDTGSQEVAFWSVCVGG